MENSVAFGVEEMSPRRKKQFRVKSSETRVSTTEEIDTRVLAGPRQCDPRYSLSPSLLSLCVLLAPLTLPAENIIYWQFAYVGRPSAHGLPPLVDIATAK